MKLRQWNNKDIVIYGSSRIEVLFALVFMINKFQKVNYVCIKGDMYVGLNMLNIRCISFEEAKKIQENCVFVISPDDYNEVNSVFDNVYLYSDFGKEEKIDIGSVLQPIKGDFFYHIALDALRYKLIIYGTEEAARILYNKLDLIGISVSFFVDDVKTVESVCGKTVYSVYDLLYEDLNSIMVINTNSDLAESTKVLTELGLKEGINFRYIQQYQYNYYRWYHWLDPQLGYNIVNKDCEKYPGFYAYGDEGAEDYKIVIGGGSTVDATLYPFRAWADFLYETAKEQGYKVTIFVGGAWGYPVETEVIKFIRDILPLKPDLFIDYSGVNNLVTDNKYPFCNVYQRQFYEKVSTRSQIRPVTYGICRTDDRFVQWLSCERIMKAVCAEFGIEFMSILQPLLGAKEGRYSSCEKEIILNTISNNPKVDYMKQGKNFSDSVKKWVGKYDWLYDFTHLFDECDNVYIDKCHVNEKGNRIIAQQVWVLLKRILDNIGHKM